MKKRFFAFSLSTLLILSACAHKKAELKTDPSSASALVYDSSIPLQRIEGQVLWPEPKNTKGPQAGEIEINLVFTQHHHGNIDPCGCSLVPAGGMEKRRLVMKSLTQFKNFILVDAGNSLIPQKGDSKNALKQVLAAHKEFPYKVHNIGSKDLETGARELSKLITTMPSLISANTTLKGKKVPGELSFDIEGISLRFIGIHNSTPENSKQSAQHPLKALAELLVSPPKTQELVIVLSDLPQNELVDFAKDQSRSLLFLGSSRDTNYLVPTSAGASKIVAGPDYTQAHGHLRILYSPLKKQYRYRYQLIELN